MTVRAVLSRHVLVLLSILLSLFPCAQAWAASVSLAWNPSPSPTVTGYEVFYGLACDDYTSSIIAGANTNVTVPGLTPGVTYYFAVLAYDASGDVSPFSSQVIYTIPPLPLITSGPLAQTVTAGATVSFDVSAVSATPMTYQWYNGVAAVSEATSNSCWTLWNVNNTNAGNYCVVISNSSGSVTSSVVPLAIVSPMQNLSASLSPGQGVQLQFTGTPGFAYILLAATNLTPPIQWQPVVTNQANANCNWTFTDTNALTMPACFYRAMLLPMQNLSASLSPGQGMQLQFTGMPGSAYVLLATTNLAPPIQWQPIVTNQADANGNWAFTDTNALTMPACFYRAMPL
jgi:hypothetical protein